MDRGEHAPVSGGIPDRVEAITDFLNRNPTLNRRELLLGLSIGALGVGQIGALVARARDAACGEGAQIDCYLQAAGLPVQEGAPPTLTPETETVVPAEAVPEQAAPAEARPSGQVIEIESLPDLGIAWLPPTVRYWGNEILSAAQTYSIDPQLMGILVTMESGGWPEAISPAEAQGLMQIWPPTGRSLASVLGLPEGQYNLFDPVTSTTFGALKLRQLLDAYQPAGEVTPSDRTVQLVATGYNGGEGRANNLLAGLPIPRETRVYSGYAVEMWQQRGLPTSPAYERWQSPQHGNGTMLITKANEYFAARGIHFG